MNDIFIIPIDGGTISQDTFSLYHSSKSILNWAVKQINGKKNGGTFQNERGSYTIEASLILPIIMFITMILLLFAVAQWEKVSLYSQATVVAEQTAATWDLESKELETGNFPLFETINGNRADARYRTLYWRLFSDGNAVSKINGSNAGDSMPQRKLNKATDDLSKKGINGTVTYDQFPFRTITVDLQQNLGFHLKIPGLGDSIEAKAISHVNEPTEFMRNIDMILYYSKKVEEHYNLLEKFKDPL